MLSSALYYFAAIELANFEIIEFIFSEKCHFLGKFYLFCGKSFQHTELCFG
jgi:hypothetical protein